MTPRTGHQDSEALIIVDENRKVVWMDQGAEALSGRTSGEVAGHDFCYSLFHCEDVGGQRLYGEACPGFRGFGQRLTEATGNYSIERSDGTRVPVAAEYRFLQGHDGDHQLGLIRMRRRDRETASPPVEPGFLKATILMTVALVGVLIIALVIGDTFGHRWLSIARLAEVDPLQPTALVYRLPTRGSQAVTGTVFVSAERGQPVTALAAECPYDGTTVQWHAGKGVFLCPDDGSLFTREGSYYKGKAAGMNLRRLRARLDENGVQVRVPASKPVPLRDRPVDTGPEYWGP